MNTLGTRVDGITVRKIAVFFAGLALVGSYSALSMQNQH